MIEKRIKVWGFGEITLNMTYKSLYNFIELKKKFQVYEGSLESILTDITRILGKKNKTKQDYTTLAFQSPRIIRALVDYKNKNPNHKDLLKLLRDGISVSLKIYQHYDNPGINGEILKLKTRIIQLGYGDLLKTKLRQHYDQINLIVSKPELSQKAAKKLNKLVGTKKAIILVIGHGAINVGMDVFLRYQDLTHRNNLLFYVVRFSTSPYKKYKDDVPQLTHAEIKYLQKQAKGKKIIIYDENSYTGTTIKNVVKYLSKNIFPRHKINVLYNLNTKDV